MKLRKPPPENVPYSYERDAVWLDSLCDWLLCAKRCFCSRKGKDLPAKKNKPELNDDAKAYLEILAGGEGNTQDIVISKDIVVPVSHFIFERIYSLTKIMTRDINILLSIDHDPERIAAVRNLAKLLNDYANELEAS